MSQWVEAMRSGAYDAAWAFAEETLREREAATRDDPAKPYHQRWVWDGRPFEGRNVLVRCYHGLGDTLQFARFLPLLAARAAKVTVEVQPRLRPLLEGLMGAGSINFRSFDVANPLPPADVDVEITELDFALRASPQDVQPPYLAVSPAFLPSRTIGLCYGAGDWDADRSVPTAMFAPLCRRASILTLMPEPTALDVFNPGGCPFDIGQTAALVAGAQLVITVDTMIAHLAGAIGKPVWLLLKSEPDWRWSPDARTSPWYPSTRLYVQPRAGDWEAVLAHVEQDLAALTALQPERIA